MATEQYDLVLMDLDMPEKDGLTATREWRERGAKDGGHLPIIGMTAHALAGDRDKCLNAGMDDYLPKPITAHGLFERIKKFLE